MIDPEKRFTCIQRLCSTYKHVMEECGTTPVHMFKFKTRRHFDIFVSNTKDQVSYQYIPYPRELMEDHPFQNDIEHFVLHIYVDNVEFSMRLTRATMSAFKQSKDVTIKRVKLRGGCFMCHQPAHKRCKKCNNALYCSTECQKKDWSLHRTLCNNENPAQMAKNLAIRYSQLMLSPANQK